MGARELDTVAVQQDGASIHALATRVFDELDMNDPAIALLAAWVIDIESGIDDTAQFVMPQGVARHGSTVSASSSKGRRGALIAGSTVLALVVSGGAAAAVTGDPLAVVRGPLQVLEKVNPFAGADTNAQERLPEPAPTTADANKLLADAQRAMANDDPVKAEKLLAEAQELLGGAVNPGQQNRIDRLNDDLANGPDSKGTPSDPNGPRGQDPADRPGQGETPTKPEKPVPGPKDPNGQGPVDKTDHEPNEPNQPKGQGSGVGSGSESKGESEKETKDDTSSGSSGQGSGDDKGDDGHNGGAGGEKSEGASSAEPAKPPRSILNG